MKIYCAHQISGLSYAEVKNYYEFIYDRLDPYYKILHPMTGKRHLRTEVEFKAHGYGDPVSTNHAIVERDRWMVSQADVVLVDLNGSKNISIGCMMELAWAFHLGKHIVVVMETDNPHRHAFVLEAAGIIFDRTDEAVEYLLHLANGDW